jgi:hypothetical protein
MLPVVDAVIPVDGARVVGDDAEVGNDDDPLGIQPDADPMTGPRARHRVAVARDRHQTSGLY